jgi:hypothetical protein
MQMSAVMAFLSGPAVADAIGAENSELAGLVQKLPDDRQLIEEIYYRALNRAPGESEISVALNSFKEIENDHQTLIKQVAKAEADWVGKKSELEIARLKNIAGAKSDLAKYLPEHNANLKKAQADQKAKVAAALQILKKREGELPALTTKFVDEVKPSDLWTKWRVLPVEVVNASDKSKVEKLSDGSIRSVGENRPRNIDYTLTSNFNDLTMTGIMIEAIPDETFEGFGPGLNNNGNFVITEVQAKWHPVSDPKKLNNLVFDGAVADFTQRGFDVKNVYNGKFDRNDKGWALSGCNLMEPHRAMLKFKDPLKGVAKGAKLLLTVANRYQGGEYPIGRFRVWYTSDVDPLKEGLPASIANIVTIAPAARSAEQKKALTDYVRENDAELLKHKFTHLRLQRPIPKDARLTALENAIKVAEQPVVDSQTIVKIRRDLKFSNQQAANGRLTAAQDLTWALINNPSFLFNR